MITSRSNPRVKLVHGLQSRRKLRQKENRFVLEGERLVQEALNSKTTIHFLFLAPSASSSASILAEIASHAGILVEEVSDDILQYCSATETAPGILAVLEPMELPIPAGLDLVLIADHFAVPGNLGTLLRSAAASGVQAVFLTEGTVDAYNPKVVRGAMGAHFRLPIRSLRADQLGELLEPLQVWIAEAGHGTSYTDIDWTRPSAIIIGSEAHGPQPALLSLGKHVSIPLSGGVESLNAAVAGSILMFEIKRQRGLE